MNPVSEILELFMWAEDLKGQCHNIFDLFFSLIEPIWVSDEQVKMFFLKH